MYSDHFLLIHLEIIPSKHEFRRRFKRDITTLLEWNLVCNHINYIGLANKRLQEERGGSTSALLMPASVIQHIVREVSQSHDS